MPCIEMGGNFCLTQAQIDSYGSNHLPYSANFREWENVVFTHSGRCAITTAVHHLGLEGCEVLVPSFSCQSITAAFMACDCKVDYYPINRDDLTVDVHELLRMIGDCRPAILYTCPLFGFDTLSQLRIEYEGIQQRGIKIMEDVTHSLFSDFNNKTVDVVVCSLRKWLEIPDGGFIWGLKDFDTNGFYLLEQEERIVSNFVKASTLKLEYLKTGNDDLKNEYLPLFYKNNDIFYDFSSVCPMSSFSHEILTHSNVDDIIKRRRANYNYLLAHIKNPLVEIVFSSLPAAVAPLYMQIYVHSGQRDALQQALIKERLYCPVIWHTPSQVLEQYPSMDVGFHEDMLSLVIDQRYDLEDMKRLAQAINQFEC